MQNPTPALSLDAILGAAVQQHTAALAAELRALRVELETREGRQPVAVHIPNFKPATFAASDHFALPKVAALLSTGPTTRVWPYLYGPPGTGKSHAAGVLAEKLGLRLVCITLGPATLPSSLFGYFDANGKIVSTQLSESWGDEKALIVFEELDNCNPATFTLLNAAIANDLCAFPDGIRRRGALLIANGNTTLTGGTKGHESRQKIDQASRDRFVFIHYGRDIEQEKARIEPILNGKTEAFMQWKNKIREHIEKHRPDIVSSQRGAYGMAVAIATIPRAVMSDDEILDGFLFRGVDPAVRAAILQACPVPRSLFADRK